LNLAQDVVLGKESSDEKSRRDDWKLPGGDPRALRCRNIPQLRTPDPRIMSWVIFQSSLRDFSDGICQPRTASWAKFSRPCGTDCKFPVLTHTLEPSRTLSFLRPTTTCTHKATKEPLRRHHYHLALLQISQVLHKVSSNSRKRRYALPQAAILKSVSILSGEGLDCGTGELPLFSLYAP
jgi:hypothetical protein